MNTFSLLNKKIQESPQKPAIIFKDTVITFSDLCHNVVRWANSLKELHVDKGTKVAIYLPNWPQYIYSYLSVFSLGAVVVPLDFMLTENEIINFINHSDSEILIAKDKKGLDLQIIQKACPKLKKIIVLSTEDAPGMPGVSEAAPSFLKINTEEDGAVLASSESVIRKARAVPARGSMPRAGGAPQGRPLTPEEPNAAPFQGLIYWKDIPSQQTSFSPPAISPGDPAAIFYTSGSTGHPKGVLLSYAHLDNPIRSIEHFLQPTQDDSYLCAGVPFSHIGGLDYMLFMLYFGSTLILMERFQPLEALKHIEKYKASIFCIVPSMFTAIVCMKESEKFNLGSLRYAVVFGAPSSPDLLKRFHALCPNAVLANGWGMTETAAPNTYSPKDANKIHSIGPFGAGMEAKIVSDQGEELPVGEKGELWVRGQAVMSGYYKEEELTREVLTPDGWLKTGDMAVRDQQGLYYLVGRKKDMIKVAGEIVFSSEIEGVIMRHPQIKDVAVIGAPDKLRGEVPMAFIVPKEGENIDENDIRKFCREYLAHFKLPHQIAIRADLPMNRMGKIDKELLKKSG